MYLSWALFLVVVLGIFILDAAVLHRRAREISLLEALVWTGFWIVLGLGFAVIVYLGHAHQWFGMAVEASPQGGKTAVAQYLGVYLLALALNLEHAFAIALSFAHYNVPAPYQTRALNWNIGFALLWRTLIVATIAIVMIRFEWAHYALGALAVFGGLRLLIRKPDQIEPDKHLFVRLLQHGGRISSQLKDERFFTRESNRRMVTPVTASLLSVIAIEASFAIGTLPALFGITPQAFIVFTATILATLALRSAYFVVLRGMKRLRYLRISLVLLLLTLGTSLLLQTALRDFSAFALALIVLILSAGIFLSLRSRKHAEGSYMPGFAQELGRLYDLTYLGLRRIVVLVIGISVIIIGILLIFTPGPAIIVIPTGLAILATEFVWARLILRKFKEQFVRYSKETKQFFDRNKSRKNSNPDSDKS